MIWEPPNSRKLPFRKVTVNDDQCYTFHYALRRSPKSVLEVCQDYANIMANTVVYARCFVQEMNRNSNLPRRLLG